LGEDLYQATRFHRQSTGTIGGLDVADPKLDFADWFAVVATALVSGIGGAMAWFNSSKKRMDARMDFLEADMRKWDESHAKHSTDIAVMETCQENTEKHLADIGLTTRDTNEKIEVLSRTVTQVLLAIQAKK
jgi:ABC-type nickel/cobalt efflux system permease component RcnA